MSALHDRARRRCGGWLSGDGEVCFRVWAPRCETVAVEILIGSRVSRRPLSAEQDQYGRPSGFFSGSQKDVPAGSLYRFQLDGRLSRPDPATRFQPQGVHGPSQLIDPVRYAWQATNWAGRPITELVIYELHVGTLTADGTFAAAIAVLDELVALGVTAVELMPVVPAPGRWNWGYDGVELFAVRETYGTPDDLRAYVDAAHARGLAVMLDVVYNHLGPEGNYLADFGPYFSTTRASPWGPAFNFDGPNSQPVRDYIIDNALMWFDEYRVDGLRLDAIQFMVDESPQPITHELAAAVRELERQVGRRLLLIGETNVYDESLLRPQEQGGAGFDAIWCDDFLHSLGTLLTGETLIPRTFRGAEDVATVLEQGALYEGPPGARVRLGESRKEHLEQFVWSIQNHDFVGNHPVGHRLTTLTSAATHRAAAALLLLHPAIPLLFMGEEFASAAAFHFFSDFGDAHLRESVIAGRQAEYPQHLWDIAVDPTSEDAFRLSQRGEVTAGDAGMIRWYHDLLECRTRWRQTGQLSAAGLTVSSRLEQHLYVLHYHAGTPHATFVAVRLTPLGTASTDITCEVDGEILLNSEWTEYGGSVEATGQPRTHVCIPTQAAVIGAGQLTLQS